jgi:hypothetical protein
MHIELTDHLRCPAPHAEAFLVLLPDRVDQRRVIAGHLGCPACGWGTAWSDGVPTFGAVHDTPAQFAFDADAAVAMLGMSGPGGWVATAGSAGVIAHDLAAALLGVRVVAVNPPAGVEATGEVSVVLSPTWPLKRASMRGVVLGGEAGDRMAAVSSALPGLRACGAGDPPVDAATELLASAGDAWVVRVR